MCRISILADIRPMGYKLSCCGSICSRYEIWIFCLNLLKDTVIAKRNMLEYNITILKWYDFHKAWIWLRFFKALKFGTGRWWRRNSIEFLVSQKENNVSWSHTNKRGHKSLVKCQKAFIRNGGQPTFPRRFCKQLENKSHNKQV